MDLMVRDLTTLVRLEEGHTLVHRRGISLEEHFHRNIEKAYGHWTNFEFKDIDLALSAEADDEPSVDSELFGRSVFHLVDNACKFCPDGGQIDIHYTSLKPGGCRILISDQGPGIPVEIRERVFDAFYQGPHPPGVSSSGLGLGLSIVRLTARSLGGDAEILDGDTGCTIQFKIPPSGTIPEEQ